MTPAVEAKPAGLCQSEGLSVSVRVIASEGSSFFPLAPVNICRWHLVQSESSSARLFTIRYSISDV